MQLLHSVITGQGKPMVILHGLFGMGDNWKSLAKKFAADFEVHVVDQRNHGRSFHSDDFSYELMVHDLLYYFSRHHIEQACILGHSMGGKTAMLFAVEFPDLVSKLIVADIAPKYYPPHHQTILQTLHAIDFKKITQRSEVDEILGARIKEPEVRQFLSKNVYRKHDHSFALRFNLAAIEENVNDIGDPLPAYTVYKGPVLFLKGADSGYIAEEDKDLIRMHFPEAEIRSVENAGHWLHAENPEKFYEYAMSFLKKA